jgi:6-phosphogluconolactonase (cycloisomerase 2 family)
VFSTMAEQGGIYALWIDPNSKLQLVARQEIKSDGNMDLSRIAPGQYLMPSYYDTVSLITLKLNN